MVPRASLSGEIPLRIDPVLTRTLGDSALRHGVGLAPSSFAAAGEAARRIDGSARSAALSRGLPRVAVCGYNQPQAGRRGRGGSADEVAGERTEVHGQAGMWSTEFEAEERNLGATRLVVAARVEEGAGAKYAAVAHHDLP